MESNGPIAPEGAPSAPALAPWPTDPTPAPASDPAAILEPQEASTPPASDPGRRRFLKTLLGFSVVSTLSMVVTPIVGFLIPPRAQGGVAGGRFLAGTTDDIPPGQGKVVAMGNKPVVVINGGQGVKAFSAICTHLGCIVAYDTTADLIICPCHNGQFNPISGVVVSGPPPAPLAPVNVAVEKNQIYLLSG
jgi:cytochrome b6-f complex iron-sulfur subunit